MMPIFQDCGVVWDSHMHCMRRNRTSCASVESALRHSAGMVSWPGALLLSAFIIAARISAHVMLSMLGRVVCEEGSGLWGGWLLMWRCALRMLVLALVLDRCLLFCTVSVVMLFWV